jgi:hypothetical protein
VAYDWDNFKLGRCSAVSIRRELSSRRVLCYAINMADSNDVSGCAEAGKYNATAEELAGIDRGLKAARERRFATDEQIEELFKKYRPVSE